MSTDALTIKTASSHHFRWVAPEPVAATPTLAVSAGGQGYAGLDALAVVAGPGVIDTLSADRRVLTLTEAVAGDTTRAAGEEWGAAFVVTPAGGVFPVRVAEVVSSTSIRLADPLPRTVDPESGSLQWATYWTTLGSANVTASARRDVTWTITYRPLFAGSADGEASIETESGRIVIADRPFSTGLTDARLRAAYSDLASTTPGRDNSRADIIAAAEAELILELLPHIRPRGLWPDDISGVAFRPAHAALAAAMIVERAEPDRAEKLRERALSLIEKGLLATWADLDADGVLDLGEEGAVNPGGIPLQAQSFSSLFNGPISTRPAYGRNQRH